MGDDADVFSEPLSMSVLLDVDFWEGMLYEEEMDWQATMFQPVGGMDRIPCAGDSVALGHPINGQISDTGYTTLLEPDGPITL